MSNIEFLSHEEVCQLTGARTKAGQIAVLARNGIRHTIKRTGWPCVVAAALVGGKETVKESSGWQPRKAG
ncbi:DUF4224 domain-containing protein [Pseudomonas asturiensis]|uniref:DUF4224 domain-containing protein n=1 Tax=Pseudomonas asturiensis TaxID=1190415 RepID=A0ABX6HCH9_9PSED|nr:DUF4224 domain-containing protein [Pseudomonas asturiensis]QHF03281.1 DUF4224 domain-containing protein [Pseudomonas asturiensis]